MLASFVTTAERLAVVPVFTGDSLDSHLYVVIAEPPVAGAVQVIVSWSTPAVAPGADIVAGTVVIKTFPVASDAGDVPAAFEAVATNV